MNKITLLAGLIAAAIASSAQAQWTGATTGTGVSTTERNYLGTGNWVGGTINDTFTNAQTGALTLYFNGPRTTSGATGVSVGGYGPFSESLTWGANGLVVSQSFNNSLTLQGGGTFGPTTAANQTLTLGGDVVNNNSGGTTANLVLGSLTANQNLNLDLGGQTRTFVAGSTAAVRNITVVNSLSNGALVKTGAGALTLQGNTSISSVVAGRNTDVANSFTLQSAGTLTSATDILVLPKAAFRIDNQSSTAITRLNSSGSITMAGGSFVNQFNPAITGQAYSETIAQFNLTAGNVLFQQGRSTTSGANTSDSTITINLGTLNRLNRSVLTIGNAATTAVTGGTNPALGTAGNTAFINNIAALESAGLYVGGDGSNGTNRKILTFATGQSGILANVNPDTFVTYDGTFGLRGLTSSEYATSFGASDNNVSLSAVTSVASSQTANSLLLGTAGATVTIDAGQVLSVTSGAILSTATGGNWNITGAGTLAFGSAEGVVSTNSRGITLSAGITGSNGLTISSNGGTGQASVVSGDNSGLSGAITILSRSSTTRVDFNNNNALGTNKSLVLGAGSIARIGSSGNIATSIASVEGGFYNNGRAVVELNDSGDSFVIGTGSASVGTLLLDGASTSTYLAPGMASGPNETKIGIIEFNGGNALALNGDIRIDLLGAPATQGSLATGLNDLLMFGTRFDLSNAGDLKLSVNSLYGTPALGTSWIIAVAGGSAGNGTITDINGGNLFDSVTAGYSVSIGSYGTGMNNALVLTAVPEASTWAMIAGNLLLFGYLIRRRRRRC